MNNAVVFWLKREAYDIGDIGSKSMTVDDLIKELNDIKNDIGGDARIFLGDQNDKIFGRLSDSKISRYEKYEVYEDEE